MSFTKLLTQLCDIQTKTLEQSGYEKVQAWSTTLSAIPCRKDSDNTARIADTNIRINTDDFIFYFDGDVPIVRGQRIIHDDTTYDVIKVNKAYGRIGVHHLEVSARLTDHQ